MSATRGARDSEVERVTSSLLLISSLTASVSMQEHFTGFGLRFVGGMLAAGSLLACLDCTRADSRHHVVLAPATPTPLGAGFVIASDHLAKARVYAGASPMSRLAAQDLCELLSRMTGGHFEVEPLPDGPAPTGILVLSADRDRVPSALSVPQGTDPTYREAFTIQHDTQRLWLVGTTELGVHHAVFRLLRELGYRWFFQSRAWQIVPNTPTLTLSSPAITDRPAMVLRSMSGNSFSAALDDPAAGRSQERDQSDWRRHNGLAYTLRLPGQPKTGATTALTLTFDQGAFGNRKASPQSIYNFIGQVNLGKLEGYPAKWFEKDPSRYGRPEEEAATTIDVGDPRVRDCFWTWLSKNGQRRPPGVANFSIEPADGTSVISRSPRALAIGNDTDQLVFLANDLLQRMAKTPGLPQKYLTMLGGYYHSLPPTKQVARPGLYVGVMPLREHAVGNFVTTASLIKAWRDAGASVALWENYSFADRGLLGPGYAQEPGGSTDYLNDSLALPRELAAVAAAGATAAVFETEDNFGRYGLGYYLTARLVWDPRADARALREDFIQRAFPSDPSSMRAYFDAFDPRGEATLISQDTLARALRLLQKAGQAAAAARSVGELARLDELKAFMHHNALWWRIFRAPHCGVTACSGSAATCAPQPECTASAPQPALVRELAEWDYRTRHSYMTSYRHDRVIAAIDALKQFGLREFEQPSYWEHGKAPTHAEIEAAMAQDLRLFTPQPTSERSFGGDPVAVSFPGYASGGAISSAGRPLTVAAEVSGGRVALCVWSGRSADTSISPGLPREMLPPLRIWLTDSEGRALYAHDEQLARTMPAQPAPGEPCETIEFAGVPAPPELGADRSFGVFVHLDAGGSKLLVRADADERVGFVMDKQFRPLNVPITSGGSYFYVPKGTKHIDYFWNRGRYVQGNDLISLPLASHELVDAAGNIHVVTTGPQQLVSVPVPADQDGKLWRIRGLSASQLWFYNVPRMLASSPRAVMLPRELAVTDGLLQSPRPWSLTPSNAASPAAQ
jgi:hypothetical protein